MPSKFINLHCHDSFSFKDGAMTPDTMVARAKELDQSAVAITNHGHLHSLIHFSDACKKYGIKGIPGMEAYQALGDRLYKESVDNKKPPIFHLTLLAMNELGLKNLYKLSSEAYLSGFYYKPRVDSKLLEKYNEGIICLSGCIKGKVQQFILASVDSDNPEDKKKWYDMAWNEALSLKNTFGDRFYIELQDGGLDFQQRIIEPLLEMSAILGVDCVVTCDAHYARKEDAPFHEQLNALARNQKITDEKFRPTQDCELWMKSEEEILKVFEKYNEAEAVYNTLKIADRCEPIEFKEHYDFIFPSFGEDDVSHFERLAREGLEKKGLAEDKVYQDRLDYEIKSIKNMGFPSYFLVVADYIKWARENKITVGPGRGSAAGSLVAYCLNITEIDPIKYDLIFERFLNPGRADSAPDIDSDFEMDRRSEVFDYIVNRYGQDKVAQIATFMEFKPRGAIRDFARAQGEPYTLGEEASKLVPPGVRGKEPTWEDTLKKSPRLHSQKYNNIVKMARKSAGMTKQVGVHAAGLVISKNPIVETSPLCLAKNKEVITQWDMNELERVGLVKMDLLGLKDLTLIQRCIDSIERSTGIAIHYSLTNTILNNNNNYSYTIAINSSIDREENILSTEKETDQQKENSNTDQCRSPTAAAISLSLPAQNKKDLYVDTTDQKTFDLISSGDTAGLFQLDAGGGIRELCVKLKPQSIEDLAIITAIYRPGPLDSGTTDSYVKRKLGQEPVTYFVPQLEPILKDTYGHAIFQEQIIRIATDLAGYTLAEADVLRKDVGKKRPEKIIKHTEKFITGMVSNDIPKDKAEKIWSDIQNWAGYGFNKAHAVSYSTITYRAAYLKAHYPVEFYCTLLGLHMNDRDKTMEYLAQCRLADIKVLPPDVNESDVGFTMSKGTIRFGLAAIKGIGETVARDIVWARDGKDFTDIFDFYNRTKSTKVNKRTMEMLAKAGALGSLEVSRSGVLGILDELTEREKEQAAYEKKLATYEKRMRKHNDREIERQEAIAGNRKPKNSLKLPEKPEKPKYDIIVQTQEMPIEELLAFEKEMLGFYVTSHPLYAYEQEILTRTNAHTASLGDCVSGEHVKLLGVVSSKKEIATKKGNRIATFELEDLHGYAEVIVFSRLYSQTCDILSEGSIVNVYGRVEATDENTRRVIADSILQLPPKQTRPTLPQGDYQISIDFYTIDLETLRHVTDSYAGDLNPEIIIKLDGYSYSLGRPKYLSQLGLEQLVKVDGVQLERRM